MRISFSSPLESFSGTNRTQCMPFFTRYSTMMSAMDADTSIRKRILGTMRIAGKMNEATNRAISKPVAWKNRSEEHTSELQSRENLVCRLLLEKKKQQT